MKVQQSNVSFGAKWPDVRKVLHSLPEEHALFSKFNYTKDGITLASKEVFLERLDRANQEVQNHKTKGGVTVNIELPPIKTLFTKPGQWIQSFREQCLLIRGNKVYADSSLSYPFERKSLTKHSVPPMESTILITHKNDSLGRVLNSIQKFGSHIFKELKKAGLEKPYEISFIKELKK